MTIGRELRGNILRVVLTLCLAVTGLTVVTSEALAHGYCETHEQIQVGMKAAVDQTQTRTIDGVSGRVQVPFYQDIQSTPDRSGMDFVGIADSYFTSASIYLDNFKPEADWTSDEITVGWYMGIPTHEMYHVCCSAESNGLEWVHTPHWFLREKVNGTHGRTYLYTAFRHPGIGGTGPIPMRQYHQVVIKRRVSSPTNNTLGIYDVYINGVLSASTSTTHQVGMIPGARGEVHGYPCVEMWSVWREDATGTAAATLRYRRYDYQQWYTVSHHNQLLWTWDPYSDTIYEGPGSHAGCFREQTVGHASTSYAYGPFDFDGPGGCMPPFVRQ